MSGIDIIAALAKLDPAVKDHWTENGLAKEEVVSELVGSTVTRQLIQEAAPKFTRLTAGELPTEPGGMTVEEAALAEELGLPSAPDRIFVKGEWITKEEGKKRFVALGVKIAEQMTIRDAATDALKSLNEEQSHLARFSPAAEQTEEERIGDVQAYLKAEQSRMQQRADRAQDMQVALEQVAAKAAKTDSTPQKK